MEMKKFMNRENTPKNPSVYGCECRNCDLFLQIALVFVFDNSEVNLRFRRYFEE